MKKFGLIGDPIAKSKSPVLFNAGYGGRYTYDLIQGGDFEASWSRFLDSYDGINVTAPFKEAAFRKADLPDCHCKGIKATNLLIKTPQGIRAYNTDIFGVMLSLLGAIVPEGGYRWFQEHGTDLAAAGEALREHFGRTPQGLVVGCGGAGRAAAAALTGAGCRTTLMNRTLSKAEKIAEDLSGRDITLSPTERLCQEFTRNDIIIYTVPREIPQLAELSRLSLTGPRIILEANYKSPTFSGELLGHVQGNGCTYVRGREWLLYQALTGYALFTGEEPDFARMCEDFK